MHCGNRKLSAILNLVTAVFLTVNPCCHCRVPFPRGAAQGGLQLSEGGAAKTIAFSLDAPLQQPMQPPGSAEAAD